MSTKFVKKISAKVLGFGIEEIRDLVKKGEKALFTIYGTCTNVKYGTGDNGAWIKFTGAYEAVNMESGEVIRSGEMFLPDSVSPILETELLTARAVEGFQGVQIAFEVGAKKNEMPIGYEFTVKDLSEPSEKDALLAMRNSFVPKKLLAKA